LTLCGGLVFAWHGNKFPFADDWELAQVLTGEQPFTARWLWAQHSEHRVPVQKVVLVAALHLSRGDFRGGILANVGALSGLAFLLMRGAKRLRGWTSYTDAFFPLILLHWGHASLLWGSHFAHVSPVVVAGIVLWIVVCHGAPVTWGEAALAAGCLVALPLCGASGLVLAPAFAGWLAWGGLRAWRSGAPAGRWKALTMLAGVGVTLLLMGLYFHDYQRCHVALASATPAAALETVKCFLSSGLGTTVGAFEWLSWLGAVLLGGSVVVLAVAVARGRADPARALGLFAFAAAMASLALAVAWGRGGDPWDMVRQRHYSILAVPAWCLVYFIWETVNTQKGSRLVPMGLLVLSCVVFWHHCPILENVLENWRLAGACERDIRAGIPARLLAETYCRLFWPDDSAQGVTIVTEELRKLQRAQIGVCRFLRDDPAAREIPLPVIPREVRQMTWKDGAGNGTGRDPQLTFALPAPRRVYGIRLRCCLNYGNGPATPVAFHVSWRPHASAAPAEERSAWVALDTGPEEKPVTILVNEPIDQFCIHPDNKPCVFRLSEIVLVAPAVEAQVAVGR
jgi:hypothetical protein